ncbi:ADP-ribosyltransferase [Shewanella algae]|uniref:ADP-ribosyltransferase n=1 Tax=Shewanella algae TaxID=38313 RepID=UPI001F242B8D|nr:ADP-ribosyltransferase [Shewanella algae]MCE9777484.1 ADP-ribosyltransferase [Shewanella algae]
MQEDINFYNHLSALSNGKDKQDKYRQYKNSQDNYCFEMNGDLRQGINISKWKVECDSLSEIICAKNKTDIVVYRMTSTLEFTPKVDIAIGQGSFRYPAFLSTSRDKKVTFDFVPPFGTPVVLKIKCPIGSLMALMEGSSSSGEQEILLGANTEYEIVNVETVTDSNQLKNHIGVARRDSVIIVEMEIKSNPNVITIPDSDIFEF